MNRVVFSTNDNPDYDFFAPLAASAWRQFGWEPLIAVSGRINEATRRILADHGVECPAIPEGKYPAVTAVQTSRICIPCFLGEDDYIMTADADMIPLSGFWPRDGVSRITGWDITGYPDESAQVPVCYVAMTSGEWRRTIRPSGPCWFTSMEAGLEEIEGAAAGRWDADQELLTRRIKAAGESKFEKVPRTRLPGLGRICRSAWEDGMRRLQNGPLIDCHALRPGHRHWEEVRAVLEMTGLYHSWMEEYRCGYVACSQ